MKTISVETPPQSQNELQFPSQIPERISAEERTHMLAHAADMVNENILCIS